MPEIGAKTNVAANVTAKTTFLNMQDDNTEAGRILHKLGDRLRAGFVKKHPARHLDTARTAIREQYAREQEIKRNQPATVPPPSQASVKKRKGPHL